MTPAHRHLRSRLGALLVATAMSSQLPNPISTPARVLDVILQAYAACAVAILAGSFGAFFHGRSAAAAEQRDRAAEYDRAA